MVKLRAAASSTVVSVFLALSTYGVRFDAAIHRVMDELLGPDRSASGTEPRPIAAPQPVEPVEMTALSLAGSLSAQSPSRLVLAVGDGETLAGVLATADIPATDVQAAAEAARRVYDPRKLRPGQFVTVDFKADDGAFQGFEVQIDNTHLLIVSRDAQGFAARQKSIPVKTETRVARGVIHGSLFESAAAAGVPYGVTATMIRAFSYDVDFQRDIQPGDRFRLMFNATVGDAGSWPGDILFAELILSGKSHAIYGVKRDDGAIDFFTGEGKSIKKGLLKTPVDGARLTSGFGMRMHPILGYTRMHKGVDFGVPTGTPIYAAGDGVIEQAGWAGGYGRFVKIRHSPHTETAYGHMSRFAAQTVAGQHVRQGEVIGYVGMTGDATGPHLHYEVLKDGAQVNPITVTIPTESGLAGQELAEFRRTVETREAEFAQLAGGALLAAAPGR